jgi:hypothetical protein
MTDFELKKKKAAAGYQKPAAAEHLQMPHRLPGREPRLRLFRA